MIAANYFHTVHDTSFSMYTFLQYMTICTCFIFQHTFHFPCVQFDVDITA